MPNFAVFGSGFGLYGYVPALIGSGHTVLLPIKYKDKLLNRKELCQFFDQIIWTDDEAHALKLAEGIVIARRPEDQANQLANLLKSKEINYIFLEKPLAPTPQKSIALMQAIKNSQKHIRIGYIFPHTLWGKDLTLNFNCYKNITIKWEFMAHHIQNHLDNWKRDAASGGGIVHFYGIQILAFIARMGLYQVKDSSFLEENTIWSAKFEPINQLAPDVSVYLNIQCGTPKFELKCDNGQEVFNYPLNSPFERNFSHLDSRVIPLMSHIHSAREADTPYYEMYDRTNDLWNEISNR